MTIVEDNKNQLDLSLEEIEIPTIEDEGAEIKNATILRKEWNIETKRRVLILAGLPGFLGPITTTIYLPALAEIERDLDTNQFLIGLTISMFTLGIGVFPLIWGPLSDIFGRKKILIVNLAFYSISSLLAGLSTSIEFLIMMRLAQALTICAPTVVGAGSIADVFPNHERGRAMGIFSVYPLIGPIIGPIIGGLITQYGNWRIIFYSLSASSAILTILLALFFPETIETKKKSFPNIFKPLIYLSNPKIGFVLIQGSFLFAGMYTMLIHATQSLQKVYGLSAQFVGLALVPFGGGQMIAAVIGGRVADSGRAKYGIVGRLIAPEIVGLIFPIFLTIFGYLSTVHISILILLTGIVGFLTSFSRPGHSTYTMELLPKNSSSVTASFVFLQYGISSILVTILSPATDAIGSGLFFLIWSLIALMSGIVVAVLMIRIW